MLHLPWQALGESHLGLIAIRLCAVSVHRHLLKDKDRWICPALGFASLALSPKTSFHGSLLPAQD